MTTYNIKWNEGHHDHLGDRYAMFASLLQEHKDKPSIAINTYITLPTKKEKLKNILIQFIEIIDTKQTINIIDDPNHNEVYRRWKRNTWQYEKLSSKYPWKENKNKICCYNDHCNKSWRKKRVPKWYNSNLFNIPGWKFINVNHPMPLIEVVQNLSACQFFISPESGLTHLATCVGVPIYIINDHAEIYMQSKFIKEIIKTKGQWFDLFLS